MKSSISLYPVSNILVGVSGSAGITDIPFYLKWLKQTGIHKIDVAMSSSASRMLSINTIIDLSLGRIMIQSDVLVEENNFQPWHVNITNKLDAILMMPATANLIGKVANGIADSILSNIVLAASCPVIFAPSMNETIWRKASVQRNVNLLRADGYIVLDPVDAISLATGQNNKGGMADIVTISTIMVSTILSKKK